MNAKDRRSLERQLSRKGVGSSNGFATVPETKACATRANGCPNFGMLLGQGSTASLAHAEMMRRARIKV